MGEPKQREARAKAERRESKGGGKGKPMQRGDFNLVWCPGFYTILSFCMLYIFL